MLQWQRGCGLNTMNLWGLFQLISVSIGICIAFTWNLLGCLILGSCVSQWYWSEVSIGGRVKDGAAKKAIASSLGDLGGANLMDLETGAFKPKKGKKEKTLEEQSMADIKSLEKKIHVLKWSAYDFCLNTPKCGWCRFHSCDSIAIILISYLVWAKDKGNGQWFASCYCRTRWSWSSELLGVGDLSSCFFV